MTAPTAVKPGPKVSKGGRITYPAKVIEFARRLGEEGYRVYEVQAELQKRGYTPRECTVAGWMDPDYAAARLLKARKRRGWVNNRKRGPRGSDLRLDRMRELRDAGLSYRSIVKVVRLDLDVDLTPDQVQRILDGRISQQTARLLLSGKQATRGRPRSVPSEAGS